MALTEKLGELKFRVSNIDAPETGSLNQRGGAKCKDERKIGYDAKEFIVKFTRGKEIKVVNARNGRHKNPYIWIWYWSVLGNEAIFFGMMERCNIKDIGAKRFGIP